jgi:CubicO group peptidase (beta-lactamase class C family)
MLREPRVAIVLLVAVVGLSIITGGAAAQNLAYSLFERYLEPLRVQAGIPGLSAVIVQEGQVVWERGFGQADVESAIAARPDTPYYVGDITQAFTTALLAQCGESGTLQPHESIRRWVPTAADPPASLRQLLSHTSGVSGGFRYDPARFALLTAVVEACTSDPFRKALARQILDRVAMVDAVPGRDLSNPLVDGAPLFDEAVIDRYRAVLGRLALPYKVDRRGRPTRTDVPSMEIDAASGLVASARDLAKFDAALDAFVLMREDTLAFTWTNSTSQGVATPMALGWFGQTYEGQRLIWHFGLVPDGYSALMLKVPGRRLTLILLANSDGLSAPFSLHEGDVTTSLFARAFLRLFL